MAASSTFAVLAKLILSFFLLATRVAAAPQNIIIFNNYTESVAFAITPDSNTRPGCYPETTGLMQEIPLGSSQELNFRFGWSGAIHLFPAQRAAGSDPRPDSTAIESSNTDKKVGNRHIDVSYVDAYTFPVICHDANYEYLAGCDIDLWNQEIPCPALSEDGQFCRNPARGNDDGPAHEWFEVCRQAAYTYPHDDLATKYQPSGEAFCCIGTSCDWDMIRRNNMVSQNNLYNARKAIPHRTHGRKVPAGRMGKMGENVWGSQPWTC